MGLHDYTIYSVIKRNARVYNDRIALIFDNKRISYKQFLERVDRLACGLLEAGLKKGDRIVILAQNSVEFLYLYGATAKIGAIVVPINRRLNSEEVEYIINDATPKMIFIGAEFYSTVTSLNPKFSLNARTYIIDQPQEGLASFDDLLQNNQICPETDLSSDDAYLIIYTAAVQGKPRGAILSYQNFIASNLQLMYTFGLTKEDVHIVFLPLFHIAGIAMVLSVMQAGGLNIILPGFDVDLVLKHIKENKVSVFVEFPPILKTLLDKAQEANCDLSCLRIAYGLDDPETVKRLEEISRAKFWIGYGQSETTGGITLGQYFEKPGSAGVTGVINEIQIVDEYGNFVEIGKSGEIVVRGPMVFKGYWNHEKENEYIFRNGWHHTGDTGRFDTDGYLWYMGRTPEKELIKSGGENVYPAEVEKVILNHPLVEEVAVIGVPDSQWGEAVKAVCVLKKGKSLNANELIEFVASRIARFKKPKYVVFVSELPKKEDGLIDRDKVKADHGKG